MAIFESSRVNFIPFFIEEFKTNNATISLVLSLSTVGSIIGSFFGGQLCEKFGHKFVYLLGSIIATIAVLIAPFTLNIFMLCLFNFIFGVGRASLSVAVDSMVPVLSIGFESILMNLTHFMYGFGSFAGQNAYGELLSKGFSWRTIYLYVGVFFVISIIFTLIIKTPNIKIVRDENSVENEKFYKSPVFYMLVLAVTFAMVSELTINTWFISYIRNSYGFDPGNAAFYASIFFLLFALGRLLGGFIVNKIGNVKGLKIFLLIGAIFVLLGLQLKENGLLFISASGFFISISFPTLMVVINKIFNENASSAIGLITTISNILSVIAFNITGAMNDLFGSYVAFYIAPLSMILCVVILQVISKKVEHHKL
jgi:fucose permease